MSKAVYRSGVSPCLLPFQWCDCAESVGCGNEIILHLGGTYRVRKHYGIT